MFTGIVQARGSIRERTGSGDGHRLRIDAPFAPLSLGESIAVNGVCLTVERVVPDGFEADVSAETLRCTTLGGLAVGAAVNLERALAAGDRLGGHLVSGHVDGIARVLTTEPVGNALRATLRAPGALAPYIAPKGSVALDGVSLTVNAVDGDTFGIMLIPHTLAVTTLGALVPGLELNLEVDLVARYVVRWLETQRTEPAAAERESSLP
ncbi:MAG: riboflavin synthase [Pseudomonadota bacterium]|nr:MAG: riboflavin synthase [Pseudomonadota bacterium]